MAAAIFVDVGESSRMSQTATRGNETDAIATPLSAMLATSQRRPRAVSFYLFVHRFRKSYISTGSTVTPGLGIPIGKQGAIEHQLNFVQGFESLLSFQAGTRFLPLA